MEKTEKVFCGNGKIINTEYGEMIKISFSKNDLETMLNNLENGWINTVLKQKKTIVEGKPTHYLEVDNWKPEKKDEQKQTVSNEEENNLPF